MVKNGLAKQLFLNVCTDHEKHEINELVYSYIVQLLVLRNLIIVNMIIFPSFYQGVFNKQDLQVFIK